MAAAVLLAACDQPEKPKPAPVKAVQATPPPAPVYSPLPVHESHWKKTRPGCKGAGCALLEVQRQQVGETALDALADAELAALPVFANKPASSWEALPTAFWAVAQPGWSLQLRSQVLWQQGPLLVLQLDSTTYTGGAHALPVTRYLNIDRRTGKALALADVLLPGSEAQFWQRLQSVHTGWQKKQHLDDAIARRTWPFVHTANFALTAEALVLKYQAYELGPYVAGQPELRLPRSQLQDLLRPEWR